MERINLPKHLRTLATLPVTDAPVVSCYQTLAAGRLADRGAFDDRAQSLRRGLSIPTAIHKRFANSILRMKWHAKRKSATVQLRW